MICWIQVLGLQVAVAVGQGEDPFGRITLGLLVSIGSTSGTTGVVMTAEVDVPGTSMSSLLQTSDDTPSQDGSIGRAVDLHATGPRFNTHS